MSDPRGMTRRELMYRGVLGAAGLHLSASPDRPRSVIVLRMDGGPSQFDTWALEPGGLFRTIPTTVPALRICEHMPRLAEHAHRMAIVADVHVPEINHRRARYLMRTGVQAPPTVVPELRTRAGMGPVCEALPERTVRRYGASDFGRQCLGALRRIERGERFAEAVLPGWDTHTDAASRLRRLLPVMDKAMAALLDDLIASDMLRTTLVVWGGEFGRTQTINLMGGRDHDPRRSCIVLAGGDVRGGMILRGSPISLAGVFAAISSQAPLYHHASDRLDARVRPLRELIV